MKSPISGKDMPLKKENKVFEYKGKKIEIEYQCFFCEDSGQQFTTPELDEENIAKVHKKYKEMYVKKDSEILTTEEINQSLEASKTPKYVHINNVKILTPKDIVKMDIYEDKYNIYGDVKIKEVAFNVEQLEKFKEKNTFIVVLRRTRKKGGPFAFPVTLKYLLSQRRSRLANLINLEKVAKAEKKENYQTAVDFIKTLIPTKEGMSQEEIFDEFQSSMDPKLICMDIKRIIQLYHQS